jgi:hypothetical protein
MLVLQDIYKALFVRLFPNVILLIVCIVMLSGESRDLKQPHMCI